MTRTSPRVLVVDDQRNMRLTLSGIIEEDGCQVIQVENGYQAIEAVTGTDFDLVLLDVKMPGIDGLQTFREIKKIRPGAVVLIMTGFAVEELVQRALEEGAYSVIYKPFDMERVIELVRSVVEPRPDFDG